jgi:hypothetical protein
VHKSVFGILYYLYIICAYEVRWQALSLNPNTSNVHPAVHTHKGLKLNDVYKM